MKDREIAKYLDEEIARQESTLDLIASENHTSEDVLEATGSRLTDKYIEGYPGKRYYPGASVHDEIELLAQKRALKLFGLSPDEWHVNVQPLSGAVANAAVYLALVKPACGREGADNEKIMGLKLSSGGHLTHGHKISISGMVWSAVQYDVDASGVLDYGAIEALAVQQKPKLIISGYSAYARHFDMARFRDISRKVGAYHMVDMAHIAGLVAGGAHPSPFEHADVVTTTTHKSLRGPRGGVIFCKKELAPLIDKAVFPGLQGGPFGHIHAAKAVCFKEADSAAFRKYAVQIVKNARALSEELLSLGATLVTGGTDNHLMVLDVRSYGIDGPEAQKRLENAGIIANMNTVPGDDKPLKPSGIRFGTPAVTTRGLKEKDMRVLARLIHGTLQGTSPEAVVRKHVRDYCRKYPVS